MKTQAEVQQALANVENSIAGMDNIACPTEQKAAYAHLPKMEAKVEAFKWVLDGEQPLAYLSVDSRLVEAFQHYLDHYHDQEEEALDEYAKEHYQQWQETAETGDQYVVSENDHSLDPSEPRFEVVKVDESEYGKFYHLTFPTIACAMEFGLGWSKAMQPSPLADSALDELEQLLALGTKAPWAINTDPKKWVTNDGTSREQWRANRDNDAALVAALRNSGAGLIARLRAAEARAYPETLTPELDEALGWPNFKCGPIAHVFQAAGYDIARKAEREQAFVLHWITGLVLKYGAGWKEKCAEEFAALREKIAVKGEQSNG